MYNSLSDTLMRVRARVRLFIEIVKCAHTLAFLRQKSGWNITVFIIIFFLIPEPSSVPSILKYAKLNSYPPPPPPHPPADPSLPRNTAFRVQWIYTKFIQTTVWCVCCLTTILLLLLILCSLHRYYNENKLMYLAKI